MSAYPLVIIAKDLQQPADAVLGKGVQTGSMLSGVAGTGVDEKHCFCSIKLCCAPVMLNPADPGKQAQVEWHRDIHTELLT